ncbi:two pore domain potassium channel family protein [Colwellia sp. BRX8-3]|uniref:potassium channel family protein n=2 Tax=unclassified Colwellia TaxID=196834 RepID=UPI0015F6DB4C|nr:MULTISPECIES: potassium channel family protein [unclassified Colwellia]MBA6356553.1 two pore domain potassium channel family protein [Colwellia sp. BRX8-3]MBA6383479.1 two pore domain potassium channel family protein [Colwellia sp. BRX10-9]MBA6351626.1 two pore domain potassium channel family protein [Colwellia sp. BRX9-1]MBA6371760.1 two pore domain potassium channel family protein [Colwellia sp. BRX8-4]MBA6378135.1 two pore domain potassium channel family protein [Colwellia sp. BRX10-7]
MMMRHRLKHYTIDEFGIKNYKSRYILILTILTLYLIMAGAAKLLLHFELPAPTANIKTYNDAFWALQVSSSTIGYGDYYPVTTGGRVVVMCMFYIGVGLMSFIGAQFINRFFGFSNTDVKNRELRRQNKEILDHNKQLEVKIDLLANKIEEVIHKSTK